MLAWQLRALGKLQRVGAPPRCWLALGFDSGSRWLYLVGTLSPQRLVIATSRSVTSEAQLLITIYASVCTKRPALPSVPHVALCKAAKRALSKDTVIAPILSELVWLKVCNYPGYARVLGILAFMEVLGMGILGYGYRIMPPCGGPGVL